VINCILAQHYQTRDGQFRIAQIRDGDLANIIEALELDSSGVLKDIESKQYKLINGVLMIPNVNKGPGDELFLRVVPKELRQFLIEQIHLSNMHSGIDATVQLLCKHFYWGGMYASVRDFISKCTCQEIVFTNQLDLCTLLFLLLSWNMSKLISLICLNLKKGMNI